MTVASVLREAHDIMNTAFIEWIGQDRNTAMEDLQYLWGMNDLAEKLIQRMEEEEKDDC